MELSQNKASILSKCTWLNRCIDEYFAPGQFIFDRSNLVDIKFRPDMCYAVMLFELPNGEFHFADVASTGYPDGEYEVCNDGESIDDEEAWKGLQVDKWLDGFTLKEERE